MSAATPLDPAHAYEQLHPRVQKWTWDQQWQSIRSVQAHAVAPVIAGRDVVIAAATASGKTEAAWLPLFSRLAAADDRDTGGDGTDHHYLGARGQGAGRRRQPPGIRALYVGPLKALINDQHMRLESLGGATSIPVHRWHGDVASSVKSKLLKRPDGILLITPESLEAMFVLRGPKIRPLFEALDYAVIDELHEFIGTERGAQLQSLLHRIELAVRRRVPRVGLSATLADLTVAADYLRPDCPGDVVVIDNPGGDTAEIQLQLRGYLALNPKSQPRNQAHNLGRPDAGSASGTKDAGDAGDEDDEDTVHSLHARTIAWHMFRTLRGHDNLAFANSRSSTEAYVDILTSYSEEHRVPNEFFPHHGNLSKSHREEVEARLRATGSPTTAVCTSTLEMGIDIGSTDSIAQIGAPPSVAALRQRLGRSGRRGTPSVMRLYITEEELTERTPPPSLLRAQTFQTVAMVDLMIREKWFEPPNTTSLHLSTLTQQLLSVIAQHGGAKDSELFSALCGNGPFRAVTRPLFDQLIDDLLEAEILTQTSDDLLLAGEVGDRLVNHHTFYLAFETSEEYRLVATGRTLGSIPVDYPILEGSLLIFAGRRWRVLSVDTEAKVIDLSRAGGGRPPMFSGGSGEVADRVRQRMRDFYAGSDVPGYLNGAAVELLGQGRDSYRRQLLDQRHLVDSGDDTYLFCWRGDRILNTLAVAFHDQDLQVGTDGVALAFARADVATVADRISFLASTEPPTPVELARQALVKERDKYDRYLSEDLLAHAYAASSLDIDAAWETLRDIARSMSPFRD